MSGTLVVKGGDRVVLATASGVSYELFVPLGVFERLPAEGSTVALSTVPIVRDDGWALYGFDEPAERTVFQRLLSITGVGPRLALAIVSTLGGGRLVRVLKDGDIAALCTVPGVGRKTAERIALELKDKLRDVSSDPEQAAADEPAEQAIRALTNLGYSANDADRAVRSVLSPNGQTQPVDLIRGALQLLSEKK